MAAIREAVVNAVLHRDYDDPGNVQIRIFDDRLEVWSPGHLVGGKRIEDLTTDDRSIPRNRNLVRLAKSLRLVEAWGTGFLRMTEACAVFGLPVPTWRHANGAFVTTFLKAASEHATPQFVSEGVEDGLLALIRATPGLRLPQLAERLAAAPKTVERWLAALRHRGAIEYHGSPKSGGYRAVDR